MDASPLGSNIPQTSFGPTPQTFRAKVKTYFTDIGNRIRQRWTYSPPIVAIKTFLGKETVISKKNFGNLWEDYGQATSSGSHPTIRSQIQKVLQHDIEKIIPYCFMQSDSYFDRPFLLPSIDIYSVDDIKKLVTLTKLLKGKIKWNASKDADNIKQYIARIEKCVAHFVEELHDKIKGPWGINALKPEDLEKLTTIKRLCPQKVRDFMITFKQFSKHPGYIEGMQSGANRGKSSYENSNWNDYPYKFFDYDPK